MRSYKKQLEQLTPMMRQYADIRDKVDDRTILMYRLGDFYEMFFEDALNASRVLSLALTGRDCGLEERAPMCGVPYHAATSYIKKLLDAGYDVAICEQLEDPSKTKGLVKRGIIRRYTPGALLEEDFLAGNENNFCASIYMNEAGESAVCYVDISTGEFFMTDIFPSSRRDLAVHELKKIQPKEILLSNDDMAQYFTEMGTPTRVVPVPSDSVRELLDKLIRSMTSIKDHHVLHEIQQYAAYMMLQFFEDCQNKNLTHITEIKTYAADTFLQFDDRAMRHLELFTSMEHGGKKGSLLDVLDETVTAKGSRYLRYCLEHPLMEIDMIEKRLEAVEVFYLHPLESHVLSEILRETHDIERLCARIAAGRGGAKELLLLKLTLDQIPRFMQTLRALSISVPEFLQPEYPVALQELLSAFLNEDAVLAGDDRHSIREGYSKEFDALRFDAEHAADRIFEYEQNLRAQTGVRSLKVKYNKVLGYFIEVSKVKDQGVPPVFSRLQTLKNVERYSTEELRQLEYSIFHAEGDLEDMQQSLLQEVLDKSRQYESVLMRYAELIAYVDMLLSFGIIARKNRYVRPHFSKNHRIFIHSSRHPVVEKMIAKDSFIPNDISFTDRSFLSVITGPNMSGKSTYMRQIALIVIMAQIGSFVPADEAEMCIVDKIFTRIGASDSISSGESTFMVEMKEVAFILQHATHRSLLVLDEVGRGTGTHDGMAIARAILEDIAHRIRAFTVFSTHYRELALSCASLEGVALRTLEIRDREGKVLFLRKVVDGVANKSYGIHVAELAGLPSLVLQKAKELMEQFERAPKEAMTPSVDVYEKSVDKELELEEKRGAIQSLLNVDCNHLSPMEALLLLSKFQHEYYKEAGQQ